MLHTKAVATQDTADWDVVCRAGYSGSAMCRLGTPFPEDGSAVDLEKGDKDGWSFNCYVNHKIDDYWVRRLDSELKRKLEGLSIKAS